MKKKLRILLEKSIPYLFYYVRAFRIRQRFKKQFSFQQKKVAVKLYGKEPITILSGPFKGLHYINEIVWGPITPKWLGSYEHDLQGIMAEVIHSNKYKVIIDIGSAEGYYVAGLASKLPRTKIHSFDVDPISRKQQKRLLACNQVSNVVIKNFCSHDELNKLIKEEALVIVDIEGYEHVLLDPRKATSLTRADILVELHTIDEISDMEKLMTERFKNTHTIRKIQQQEIDIEFYYDIAKTIFSQREIIELTNEHRHYKQTWLWMESVTLMNHVDK